MHIQVEYLDTSTTPVVGLLCVPRIGFSPDRLKAALIDAVRCALRDSGAQIKLPKPEEFEITLPPRRLLIAWFGGYLVFNVKGLP